MVDEHCKGADCVLASDSNVLQVSWCSDVGRTAKEWWMRMARVPTVSWPPTQMFSRFCSRIKEPVVGRDGGQIALFGCFRERERNVQGRPRCGRGSIPDSSRSILITPVKHDATIM